MGDPAKQLVTPVWEVYKKIQLLKHACFSHSSCGTNCKHFVHWRGKRVAFYTIPRQGCLQNIGFLYSKVRATCLQVAPSVIKNGTPGQTCCDHHNFYSSLTKWLDCWEKKKGLDLMCQGLGTSCFDMTCRVISHDACHVMSCHVACHVMSSVILCGKNPTPSFREKGGHCVKRAVGAWGQGKAQDISLFLRNLCVRSPESRRRHKQMVLIPILLS